ncbi:MAG TPA: carboxymuconolactone decarboxylase family protein, partial [Acidimicrobiales bacterium]|nr:carboxymuconolactone decarboxylase family protein [Acidimicrobiales bacterium]
MAGPPKTPRIAPLGPGERDTQADELLAASMLPTANIFTTLARAPGLMRKWLPFGGKLLNGKLEGRDREILILRTAANCRAEYEWAQHALIGRRVGLSQAEIEGISRPTFAAGDGWSPLELALLQAADELHADQCIGDETWDVLSSHYDVQQLIEVPMLVGQYHMVAMTLKSLGVELDEG